MRKFCAVSIIQPPLTVIDTPFTVEVISVSDPDALGLELELELTCKLLTAIEAVTEMIAPPPVPVSVSVSVIVTLSDADGTRTVDPHPEPSTSQCDGSLQSPLPPQMTHPTQGLELSAPQHLI